MLAASGLGSLGGGLVALLIIVALYFLPTIIANSRKVPNQGSIAVINIFLGWTFIGWIVALAMAFRSVPQAPTAIGSASVAGPAPGHPAVAQASTDDTIARLKELADLYAQGVLSDDEFTAAKARLLGG